MPVLSRPQGNTRASSSDFIVMFKTGLCHQIVRNCVNGGMLRNVRPHYQVRVGLGAHAMASIHLSGADFNSTVEEALQIWHKRFSDQKIDEPLESIANILAFNLNTNKISEVYKHRKHVLSDVQMDNVMNMCEKRMEKMPVQYIIGEWDFRELTLKIRPPVFIPRPETEILVELVLEDVKKRNVAEVLELCCGSGAISLALLNQVKNLRATATDKSSQACRLTLENAIRLKLDDRIDVKCESVEETGGSLSRKFDIIVSNPPYVLAKDMRTLQPEILMYEDLDALDGGEDGLDVVKQIFAVSSAFLNPGGKLFLEVDPSHPQLIRTLLRENHRLRLRKIAVHKDLCNEMRFVEIIKS